MRMLECIYALPTTELIANIPVYVFVYVHIWYTHTEAHMDGCEREKMAPKKRMANVRIYSYVCTYACIYVCM
jgi:hypothetical protein